MPSLRAPRLTGACAPFPRTRRPSPPLGPRLIPTGPGLSRPYSVLGRSSLRALGWGSRPHRKSPLPSLFHPCLVALVPLSWAAWGPTSCSTLSEQPATVAPVLLSSRLPQVACSPVLGPQASDSCQELLGLFWQQVLFWSHTCSAAAAGALGGRLWRRRPLPVRWPASGILLLLLPSSMGPATGPIPCAAGLGSACAPQSSPLSPASGAGLSLPLLPRATSVSRDVFPHARLPATLCQGFSCRLWTRSCCAVSSQLAGV